MSENLSKNMEIFSFNEKGDKKMFRKKKRKKIRTSQKIIIGIFLLFVFFIVFLYFHTQITVERILSEEQLFQQDKVVKLETAKDKISQDDYQPISYRFVRTFGDSFTGLATIDRDLTDMYWDSTVSAFLFPPRISMQKLEDCGENACGYFIQDESWQGFCSGPNCLENDNNQLIYNKENLNLPKEINEEKLISISLGAVGSDWYLGFILGNNIDEKALIYRFDGEKYHFLLEFNIRTGRINGNLSFGGTRNDLYIIYGGYFGQIKRLKNESEIIDLDDFFNLRFTTSGFFPKIQNSARSQAVYVCNTNLNRTNILKLWKDREGEVIGAVDLRNLAFFDISVQRLDCLPGDETFDLKILIKTREGWQKWGMIDNGFNNKIIRQVVSRDINASNRQVRAAIINSYSINSEKHWKDTFQLFFSADNENFTPVLPGNWYKIQPPGDNLYWRVIFRNDMENQYYSPWLNNFSVINYEIVEEIEKNN